MQSASSDVRGTSGKHRLTSGTLTDKTVSDFHFAPVIMTTTQDWENMHDKIYVYPHASDRSVLIRHSHYLGIRDTYVSILPWISSAGGHHTGTYGETTLIVCAKLDLFSCIPKYLYSHPRTVSRGDGVTSDSRIYALVYYELHILRFYNLGLSITLEPPLIIFAHQNMLGKTSSLFLSF